MIQLYGFGPGWELPDCSHFVVKVDCYLRMTKLPYIHIPWQSFRDLQNAPHGKFPYIEDQGKKIADSAYGAPLGEHTMDPHNQAMAHSLRRMMEEGLYWVLLYSQWVEEAAWEAFQPEIFRHLPPAERQEVAPQLREAVRGYLHAQGIGRHAREEVYALGNADLSALSTYLGEKPYFLGAQPTALDATAYAFLTRVVWTPYESPLKTHAQSLPNLEAYCMRMKQQYYSGNDRG